MLERFSHTTYTFVSPGHVPCWYCYPNLHWQDSEAQRGQDLFAGPLLSKWTWQAWNAGGGWQSPHVQRGLFGRVSGSDHAVNPMAVVMVADLHILSWVDKEGMELFVSNSNPTVPLLARGLFRTHSQA